ncbi:MAG: T9SS type A sorting domain-containing protein [Fluviicola sp.]
MRIALFSIITCISSISFAQELNFGWRQKSTKEPEHFESKSIIVQDTVYTFGIFETNSTFNSVDVHPGTSNFSLTAQAGYFSTCFVKKSLPDGTFIEAKKLFETSNYVGLPKFHVTQQGRIILIGSFSVDIPNNSLIDFDPSTVTVGSNSTDSVRNMLYVAFYDLNGTYLNHLEHKHSPSGDDIYFSDMVENSQNELFLTGYFNGTIDADFTSGTDSITSNGYSDAIVVKISLSNYSYGWSKTIGGSSTSRGSYIEANDQHVFIAGAFSDTNLDLDPSGNTAIQNNPAGLSSGFVDVLDASNGNFVRGFSLVGTPNSASSNPPGSVVGITGFAIDDESNIYVQGATNANQYIPLDLDPTSGTEILQYYGAGNSFLAKYDATNHLQWSKYLYDFNVQSLYHGSTIALEGSRIAMTIKTDDIVLSGPVSAPTPFITLNPQERSIFVGIFDKETGNLMDHHELVTNQSVAEFQLNSIHMDRFKNVYLDLNFRGKLDFNQFNTIPEIDSSNYYVVSPTEVYFTYNSALLKLNWEGDLGINEFLSENELFVYPNPTAGSFTIKAESPILSYRIFSNNGRLIREVNNLNNHQVTEELASFSNGLYLIRVETQNGSAVSRLVKQ